jgi:putative oxidoreductase
LDRARRFRATDILPNRERDMIDQRAAPYGVLLLRVVSGLWFIAHGCLKIFVFTPAGTAKFFESLGLPGALAYLIIALEVVGGLALIFGVYARAVAVVLAVELLGTIVTLHGANGFVFTNPNGGWEYPAFWAITLVAVALLGDGSYALRATPIGARRS